MMRSPRTFRLAIFGGLLVASAAIMSAAAAGDAQVAHALSKDDLEAFFDGIIPLQLERSDIAGAAVLVMKDGATLLQKGYGYSDLKPKEPVDPATTVFRLASISKLFTWISVMQLVEEGKLDLDADIGQYLDFPIKRLSDASKPITLRNLMTHTGGYEETVRNIIVTDKKYYLGLREFLIENQPNRLFEPGTIPGYSNYGVGLGSYIVQRSSGEPFEQYVAEHIFSPLGMTHSTFFQPPPKDLENLPSKGYPSSTRKPAIGFELFSPVGAGGLSSSAADMGRFAAALLNGGELEGRRILKQDSLETMWKPQFRASDELPPIGLGFYQVWRNELRWIGHQGDLIAFHSLFFLEPRHNLAIFISYNSAGSAAKARAELLNNFTDRYFPLAPAQPFINVPLKELKDIEGVYQSTRRADSTQLKAANLFAQRHLLVDKDGVLHSNQLKDLRGHPIHWKPIGKDLWQEVGGQSKLFAIRAADGRIARVAGGSPSSQMQRVPWYERDDFLATMLGGSFLIFCCVLIATLVPFVRRFVFQSSEPIARIGAFALTALPRAAALYWMLLIVAFAIVISSVGGDDMPPPTAAWDKYFLITDVLCAIALALSAVSVISAVSIWRRAGISVRSRLKFALVALACVSMSWFVVHWNVLGPIHRL
jgi:CubicO group peptidase (beta-lactamase class C family)